MQWLSDQAMEQSSNIWTASLLLLFIACGFHVIADERSVLINARLAIVSAYMTTVLNAILSYLYEMLLTDDLNWQKWKIVKGQEMYLGYITDVFGLLQ